jgi:hypothetical protein
MEIVDALAWRVEELEAVVVCYEEQNGKGARENE